MSKLVLILSLLSLLILLSFGIADPNNPVVWLASTSTNFGILRIALIAVLLALLLTNPPRNIYFRGFVTILSTTLVAWSLGATYANEMKFLDTLSLLQVSISAGLIALERDIVPKLPFTGYEISPAGRYKLRRART